VIVHVDRASHGVGANGCPTAAQRVFSSGIGSHGGAQGPLPALTLLWRTDTPSTMSSTRSNRSRALLVPAAFAVLIALSGCAGGTTPKAGGEVGSSDAKTSDRAAGTTTAVIAEQKFAATTVFATNDNPGGTVTTTLRALEVSGKTMTLRWAIRWDNPGQGSDAKTSMLDLGAKNLPTLTDTVNLKQYRPLCTKGSWQGDSITEVWCSASVLVSPSVDTVSLPNHSTVEAWALFAAPQDKNAKVDVLVVDGWPTFSAVTPTAAK
jgi:hypothetical protein